MSLAKLETLGAVSKNRPCSGLVCKRLTQVTTCFSGTTLMIEPTPQLGRRFAFEAEARAREIVFKGKD